MHRTPSKPKGILFVAVFKRENTPGGLSETLVPAPATGKRLVI